MKNLNYGRNILFGISLISGRVGTPMKKWGNGVPLLDSRLVSNIEYA